jgi:hypothetical protein
MKPNASTQADVLPVHRQSAFRRTEARPMAGWKDGAATLQRIGAPDSYEVESGSPPPSMNAWLAEDPDDIV